MARPVAPQRPLEPEEVWNTMFNQLAELSLNLEHRHSDGSWATFERVPHDSSEHDPERDWGKGEMYLCTRCDELVRVTVADDSAGLRSGGAT